MQAQNTPPADTPTKRVPLEERGHLTRTQLYMVAAFLSIAVLGLVGYIAWDYFKNEDNVNNHVATTTTETQDETEEAEEERVDSIPEEPTQTEDIYEWTDIGYTFELPDGWSVSTSPQYGTLYQGDIVLTLSPEENTYTISLPCMEDTIGCTGGVNTLTDVIRIAAIPNTLDLELWVEDTMFDGMAPSSESYSPESSPGGTTYHMNTRSNCWDACGYDPIDVYEYFFIPEDEDEYLFGILVYGQNAESLESKIFSLMDSLEKK